MKKISLLLVVSCMLNIQADKLSDAIRNSDLEEVKLLLLNHVVEQNFVKYFDTAEQILQQRRDAIAVQHIEPHCRETPEVRSIDRKVFGCFFTAVGLIMPGAYFNNLYYEIPWDQRDDIAKINYNTVSNWFMGASGIAWLATFGYCILSLQQGIQAEWKHIRKLHDNAVIIKELLYDHVHKFRQDHHIQ